MRIGPKSLTEWHGYAFWGKARYVSAQPPLRMVAGLYLEKHLRSNPGHRAPPSNRGSAQRATPPISTEPQTGQVSENLSGLSLYGVYSLTTTGKYTRIGCGAGRL